MTPAIMRRTIQAAPVCKPKKRDLRSSRCGALISLMTAKTANATSTAHAKKSSTAVGLIVTLGFLMLVSLVVSAGLTPLGGYLSGLVPGAGLLMSVLNWTISLALISALFAAIYKILPDKPIAWRDVAVGSVATGILFTIGKSLIGFYIGSSSVASSYGAAGALAIMLLWVDYSAQIFLLGAEYTRAYAETHGSHARQ